LTKKEASMKVHFVSDLHLEFWKPDQRRLMDKIPSALGDVLVLAGDILTFSSFKKEEIEDIFAEFAKKAATVVFVAGNHEFYGRPIDDTLRVIDEIVSKHCKVLARGGDVVNLPGGKKILGATLWFPEGPRNVMYEKSISDFELIKPFRRSGVRFRKWVYEEHVKDKAYLRAETKPGDILITHHLPGMASVPPQYKGSPLNAFFVANAESIAYEKKPALWIHGHTHAVFDYKLDETRVLCNAAGYPDNWNSPAENTGWEPGRVVEVEEKT
jgi:predicted phosphodiesterase